PRNIMDQAFKLLNAPYGWGGAQGEQDCSGFLQEVFSTVGILLPRDSSAQAKVGVPLGQFEKNENDQKKLDILSHQAIGGVTVIRLDNHIMLFLGMVEDKPYAIHATWGFRERGWPQDRVCLIGRVAVTGLDLGKGSSRGSLLERIISIKNIIFPSD
ncbi:MAG: NlpC/P60 family protein, partial [Candidatus Omnitrophica bacterium]|nr:NlpC/P60 family protein [Candidatus Omnitrophota bacterium]